MHEFLRGFADVRGGVFDHITDESVQRHGRDDRVVGFGPELALMIERRGAGGGVDRDELGVQLELIAQEGREAVIEIARAAERVLECVVWSPAEVVEALVHVAFCALPVEDRDAFADPGLVHLLGGAGPDLEVVRPHELLGDARAEDVVDELAEVAGAGGPCRVGLRLDQAVDAGLGVGLGEVSEVVLEWVRHPGAGDADPALALVGGVLALHELFEDAVVLFVVTKEDVPADVPGEAVLVGVAACQAADVVGGLDEGEVGEPDLAEAVGGPEARGAGADDEDASRVLCLVRTHLTPGDADRYLGAVDRRAPALGEYQI